MKKILVIFGTLLMLAVSVQAQERTVLLNRGNALNLQTSEWYAYNGTTSDRLIPTTRDTIDYVLRLEGQSALPNHFYARITFDTIAGADTTVLITVQQKKFPGEAYSDIIASAASSAVSGEINVVKTSLGVTTEFTETLAGGTTTTRLANTALYGKYIKIRLILPGDDTVGTGIKVERIEFNFFN